MKVFLEARGHVRLLSLVQGLSWGRGGVEGDGIGRGQPLGKPPGSSAPGLAAAQAVNAVGRNHLWGIPGVPSLLVEGFLETPRGFQLTDAARQAVPGCEHHRHLPASEVRRLETRVRWQEPLSCDPHDEIGRNWYQGEAEAGDS